MHVETDKLIAARELKGRLQNRPGVSDSVRLRQGETRVMKPCVPRRELRKKGHIDPAFVVPLN